MCGIAGIWDFENRIDVSVLEKMKLSLMHRGPDSQGVYIDDENNAGFVHTRLSIIDLSEKANQPLVDEDLGLLIVYNGEIYNYKEIKNQLQKIGYKFFSDSDTEVILKSYFVWGINFFEKLRGMFAFCIFDVRKKEMILARDRFGIKPLYYFYDGKKFIFASEIKSVFYANLNSEIDFKGVECFLYLGYILPPFTFYKNIFSLEPGHFLKLNKKEGIRKFKYYNLEKIFSFQNYKKYLFEEAILQTKNELLESIRYHLVSDVEVGAFLSGGIDSSSIVSLMRKVGHKKIKTVSVIFPENSKYNEGKYAKTVAEKFGTEHLEIEVRKKDLLEHLEKIFNFMDQPTVNGVNVYFVSLAAKRAGLKTILSGLGGDEIFGGYPSFREVPILYKSIKFFKKFPKFWVELVEGNKRFKLRYLFSEKGTPSFVKTYLVYRGLFTPDQLNTLVDFELEKDFIDFLIGLISSFSSIKDNFNRISFLEIFFYMKGQLLRDADVFSMAHSLEVRVPFVDHFLIKHIAEVPSRFKFSKNSPKKLLVESVEDLPKQIIYRPKMGFTFPFSEWLREKEIYSTIETSLKKSNIFNKLFINDLLQLFLRRKLHWSRIWGLFVLDKFFKKAKKEEF